MMDAISYLDRRGKLQDYFDRTANDAWAKLTSDAPVSGIRATVRAGRDQMRNSIIGRLPENLSGKRVLDAGCGTGALALELAKRGALVTAVDLSPNLIELAKSRIPESDRQNIEFYAGDMLDEAYGDFDYVIGMDSMIHYEKHDMVYGLAGLCQRTTHSVLFTFAPSNPILATMIRVGRIFPRGDRAPFIEPVAESALRSELQHDAGLKHWTAARTEKISSGFYTSQAWEWHR